MHYRFLLSCFLTAFLIAANCFGQKKGKEPANAQWAIQHVEPMNWWVGMKHNRIQLLLHGHNLSQFRVTLDYPGVVLESVQQVENPNYLFLNLQISPTAKAGNVPIIFSDSKKSYTHSYPLLERKGFEGRIQGLSPRDFIYLIMPDRFANGDPTNDRIAGMNDQTLNRDSLYHRHGGDLKGVQNQLDYLQNLGVTALWLNPVLENDQPKESYHGYAATNLYQVDRRFGGNQAYLELIDALHARGMKIIMDIIHNHVGAENWLIKDLPAKNWLHQHEEFTRTSYRAPTVLDPYVSEYDRKQFIGGWFDKHMPDLAQENDMVATYIIQNNLWWIEYAGIDAYRMDTWAYSDKVFLDKWTNAILTEYPHFGIFAEVWDHGTATQAYFHGRTIMDKDFKSKLPGLIDFQLYYAINATINDNFGWTEGVSKLYYTLAHDYLMSDPTYNVTFLDNHDLSRFFAVAGQDYRKFEIGMGLLMTLRGIPSLYYGTEILMADYDDGRGGGTVRKDFPGGWPADKKNAFTGEGMGRLENNALLYVKKLAQYRLKTPALYQGKLMQFVPFDGVYAYFRYDDQQTIMVIVNSTDQPKTVDTKRFAERMNGFTKAVSVVSDLEISSLATLNLPAKSIQILELKK